MRIKVSGQYCTAFRAVHDINNLELISLDAGMTLFGVKILTVLTYGIQLLWFCLFIHDMTALGKMKALFLKRALHISKFTAPQGSSTTATQTPTTWLI
jgi:hypothetical protein